jgi:hypothetical protein
MIRPTIKIPWRKGDKRIYRQPLPPIGAVTQAEMDYNNPYSASGFIGALPDPKKLSKTNGPKPQLPSLLTPEKWQQPAPPPAQTALALGAPPTSDADVAQANLGKWGSALGAMAPYFLGAGAPRTIDQLPQRAEYLAKAGQAFTKEMQDYGKREQAEKLQGLQLKAAEQKMTAEAQRSSATKSLADRYRKAGKPILAEAIEGGHTELIKAALAGRKLDSNQLVTQERAMRTEFEKAVEEERDQINAYARIEAIWQNPDTNQIREFKVDGAGYTIMDADGAADLALIFNFMKLLDPKSVVRESEFRMAGTTGGWVDWVKKELANVIGGQKLSAPMRKRMMRQARNQFDSATTRYGNKLDKARARVGIYEKGEFGISAERVFGGTGIYQPLLKRETFRLVGGAPNAEETDAEALERLRKQKAASRGT